jgi:hypothetical protein
MSEDGGDGGREDVRPVPSVAEIDRGFAALAVIVLGERAEERSRGILPLFERGPQAGGVGNRRQGQDEEGEVVVGHGVTPVQAGQSCEMQEAAAEKARSVLAAFGALHAPSHSPSVDPWRSQGIMQKQIVSSTHSSIREQHDRLAHASQVVSLGPISHVEESKLIGWPSMSPPGGAPVGPGCWSSCFPAPGVIPRSLPTIDPAALSTSSPVQAASARTRAMRRERAVTA